MAVLKFRAWHKAGKKFYECYGVELGEKGSCYIQDPHEPNRVLAVKHDEFEVTQSTGLKDSFGVEIFEGDRVMTYEDSELERVVTWNHERGAWFLESSRGLIGLHFYGKPIHKVVGNIYQNLEIK